jgi:hypothetical protein
MKNVVLKGFIICFLTLAFCLGTISTSFADDGFYLGISRVTNSIGTHDTSYSDYYNEEHFTVPTLQSGNGLSITGGIDFTEGALEFSFTSSTHAGDYYQGTTYNDGTYNATYNILDINFKKFVSDSEIIRPYWLVGFCITSLVVEDGYYDSYYHYYDDATYTGVGLNLGGGIDLKILPSLSLKGEVIYRAVAYSSAGTSDYYSDNPLSETFGGSGYCYNVGLNFYF